MSINAYTLIARQIANFTNRCVIEGFDPQHALQEAIEQYGELQYGWSMEFAAEVYAYVYEAWKAGLLAYTTVETGIAKADG